MAQKIDTRHILYQDNTPPEAREALNYSNADIPPAALEETAVGAFDGGILA